MALPGRGTRVSSGIVSGSTKWEVRNGVTWSGDPGSSGITYQHYCGASSDQVRNRNLVKRGYLVVNRSTGGRILGEWAIPIFDSIEKILRIFFIYK